MIYQKTIKLLFIGLTCFFSFACNRSNDSTTKISIALPTASSSAKSETVATSGTGSDNGTTTGTANDWSVNLPQSVSSFNCYIAMVSGPEDLLKRNSCGKKIAAGSDAYSPTISFGPIEGAIYAGKDLEIEVASGANRVIVLAGFVASSEAACVDYTNDLDKTKLSKPYILGQSAPITLVGDTVSVPITMKLDSEAWFDECSGPEFNQKSSDSSGTPIATTVKLTKDLFPIDMTVESVCNAFQVELKDGKDNNAVSTSNSTIGIKQSGTLATNFPTYLDCMNNTLGSNTFVVQAGQHRAKRWLKTTDNASHPNYTYTLDLSATNLNVDSAVTGTVINNYPAGYSKLHLTGPTTALAGQCYRYDLAFRQIGADEPNAGYVVGDSRIVAATLSNGAFYSDSNCTTLLANATGNILMDNSTTTPKAIYVKFFANQTLSRYQNTFNVTYSGVGSDKLVTTVYNAASNLTTLATKSVIQGDFELPKKTYKCYGPYRLTLTNAFNIEVPTSAAITYEVTNSIPNSNLKTSCNSSNVSTLQIPAGASFTNFYIVANTSPLSSGTISVKPVAGVTGASWLNLAVDQLPFTFN